MVPQKSEDEALLVLDAEGAMVADAEALGTVSSRPRSRSAVRTAAAAALAFATVSALWLSGQGRRVSASMKNLIDEAAAKTPEGLLPLSVAECTTQSGCRQRDVYVTLDQNWRWYYNPETWKGCTDCTATSCSTCVVQADIKYGHYGMTTSDGNKALEMKQGGRVYVLDETGEEYLMFSLVGKEISWDIDLSALPCGINSAVYLVEMEKNGGAEGGAALGQGYCDAQCPNGATTVGGKANYDKKHQCCNEFDLWEANSESTAYTLHPCMLPNKQPMVGPYQCSGEECVSKSLNGLCDAYGCDLNPYRNGEKDFYGKSAGATVNTNKVMTVTTQFIAKEGKLVDVRRFYIQDGKTIEQPTFTIDGQEFESITPEYCVAELTDYKDSTFDPNDDTCSSTPVGPDIFTNKGGVATQGESLDRGNVLVLSLWNDPSCHMLWLDGNHGEGHGGVRGPCGHDDASSQWTTSPKTSDVSVTFSNIRFGDIGSTTSVTQ